MRISWRKWTLLTEAHKIQECCSGRSQDSGSGLMRMRMLHSMFCLGLARLDREGNPPLFGQGISPA